MMLQGLEKRVEEAEAKRKQAEAELEKHKAQIAPTRTKIEAFGKRFVDLEQSYRLSQEALQRTEARCNAEQKAKAALEPRLKAAESRVVELEVGLRPGFYLCESEVSLKPYALYRRTQSLLLLNPSSEKQRGIPMTAAVGIVDFKVSISTTLQKELRITKEAARSRMRRTSSRSSIESR